MKQILTKIAIGLSFSLLLFGCHNEIENELGLIERRIEALETRCDQMNTNITSLQAIVDKLNKFDFVSKVSFHIGPDGVNGYTISFTNSPSITLFNGHDAETPKVGVKMAEDSVYYWILRYESGEEVYITNNYGQKIEATAASPIIKIEDGNWMISYDKGEIWHNLGQATGKDGTSFVRSVEDSVDYIKFNFLDGTSVNIPTWSTFETVKEMAATANANYQSLSTLISNFDQFTYAQDVNPILSGKDTVGYRIYLSNGVAVPFYNGVATNMPTLSAQQDPTNPTDTAYYWTIKYHDSTEDQFIKYLGSMIRADAVDGITPIIGLDKFTDNLYYWTISYDGGESFSWMLTPGLTKILASAPANNAVITAIENGSNYVTITIGGQQIVISKTRDIEVTINTTAEMLANVSTDISYNVVNCPNPELLVIANNGFKATIIKDSESTGKIRITSPTTFAAGQIGTINFLISDGKGSMKSIVINITYGE